MSCLYSVNYKRVVGYILEQVLCSFKQKKMHPYDRFEKNFLPKLLHCVLTVLHPWSSWSVCPGVEWRAKVELPVAAPAPGHDLPRMKQKQGWSHGRESDYGGTSAGAGVQGLGSVVEHTAWPEGRVSFRSAFRMPAASLLVHNDCIQPGRSHHVQGRGQKWTCLEGEGRK